MLITSLSYFSPKNLFELISPASHRVISFFVVVSLFGCVSITSTTPLQEQTIENNRTSFAYLLPRAVIPIQLKEQNGRFFIDALNPKYHGDPKHLYYGSHKASFFSSDTVNVSLEPNGLLKSVNVTADDKTGDFLVNLAKSLAAIKTGFGSRKESSPGTASIVAAIDIDPSDESSVVRAESALTEAAHSRVHEAIASNCSSKDATKQNLCKNYQWLHRAKFRVRISSRPPDIVSQTKLPDCTIGVCFRLPLPYQIAAGFETKSRLIASSAIVPLPNNGPVILTTFDRALFVKKVTNAGFKNGMLTSLKIEKPSEAAAVALLPATIIGAFFNSITETFKSQKDATTARIQYLNELKKLEDRQTSKENSESKTVLLNVGFGSQATIATPTNAVIKNPIVTLTGPQGDEDPKKNESSELPFEKQSQGCAKPPCSEGD